MAFQGPQKCGAVTTPQVSGQHHRDEDLVRRNLGLGEGGLGGAGALPLP